MKIGIVGSGNVGATAAFAMVMRGVGRQIVMVDLDPNRAQAEADDILHAVPFAQPLQVRAGDYEDLAQAAVVVITAGVRQKPGESRRQLLERNAAVFRDVIPKVLQNAADAVLVIASNPVDVMTHLAARYAAEFGVPSSRVIGTGTTLDTARFRAQLSGYLGVDSHHVHAYVLGEHGDSEVVAWSEVGIGGIPLDEFCAIGSGEITEEVRDKIEDDVRHAAYSIIEGKGATYYGIGAAIAQIVNVIVRDQRAILTVCTPMDEVVGVRDVTVALPNVVGGQGIISTCLFTLTEEETAKLRASAQIVREALDEVESA